MEDHDPKTGTSSRGSIRRTVRQAASRTAAVAREAERASTPLADLDEADLMAAMRRLDSAAIEEYLIRYERLLFHRARAAGISRLDCEDCIIELLEEVADRIINQPLGDVTSLSGYLVRAFRNRYANVIVARDRRSTRVAESNQRYAEAADDTDLLSEHTRRVSQPSGSPGEHGTSVRMLTKLLDTMISDEERLILGWLANYVPQRTIAEWLNLSYAAATQRIWRLKTRLRTALLNETRRLPPSERQQVDAFFRRAGLDPTTRKMKTEGPLQADSASRRRLGEDHRND